MRYRYLGTLLLAAAVAFASGCAGSLTATRGPDGKVTIQGTICSGTVCGGGGKTGPIMNVVSRFSPLTAQPMVIDASTIYIDTAGTNFAVGSTGSVTLNVEDASGNALGSQAFTWVASGTRLVFQNVPAVQTWLDGFPTAANVTYAVGTAGPPMNGASHTMTAAVVYQGTTQAMTTITFAAQCAPPSVHTVTPCHL
jgi:hypothetical protein